MNKTWQNHLPTSFSPDQDCPSGKKTAHSECYYAPQTGCLYCKIYCPFCRSVGQLCQHFVCQPGNPTSFERLLVSYGADDLISLSYIPRPEDLPPDAPDIIKWHCMAIHYRGRYGSSFNEVTNEFGCSGCPTTISRSLARARAAKEILGDSVLTVTPIYSGTMATITNGLRSKWFTHDNAEFDRSMDRLIRYMRGHLN